MARVRCYEFTVKGRGKFPIDMLRYDSCHPRHEADSNVIAHGAHPNLEVEVQLLSWLKPPTPDRWHSFGWHVIELTAVENGGYERPVDVWAWTQ